jgi:hypothetical protein
VQVGSAASRAANGYVLVAPFDSGPTGTALIVDEAGEPVWVHQSPNLIMDFRVQRLGGKPVLTWWEGRHVGGFFAGQCVIADERYRVLKRLGRANGLVPEVHEFLITARDTALISCNNFVQLDLTAYGGPADGTVIEGVVQEIDIATGDVLFEWHSLDGVAVTETLFAAAEVWDYFHINSIDLDPSDGNYVVSARNTSAIYKIDHQSRNVVWRLGGSHSDFRLGDGAAFWFQHDARVLPGGLLSLFDDGAEAPNDVREQASRVLVLALDTATMTAEVASSLPNPTGRAVTYAMGNAQRLAHGGFFVGWGTTPQVSELAADGSLLFDATFPDGHVTYRAYRAQWQGRAPGRPSATAVRNANRSTDVYVSWNGATRVSHWRVDGGSGAPLRPLKTVRRAGFETRIRIPAGPRRFAVAALDARGRVIGRSPIVSA